MITIQSAMLVALGFLIASLLALVVAPAFWARAVRLTTQRIKDTMPVTEMEIRADKDRLRAEYAIRIHRLESQVEQVRMAEIRQQVEINRRDASINVLESELDSLRASHEESQNARRVLEQTVADRLPRVEQRLGEARNLLQSRDQHIAELNRTAEKQQQALAEATAINAQQQSEIERLGTSLAARGGRNQNTLADPRFDGEVALRAEIESLRAKTREQAQLLTRMQSLAARPAAAPALSLDVTQPPARAASAPGVAAMPDAPSAETMDTEREMRALRARIEDQAGEITRLKTALAVFENDSGEDTKLSQRMSRIGLKARVQSLEAQTEQQTETIQKLRSELASANERLARQGAHFATELKRLGAGTLPASGQARRSAEPARLSLAERVAQTRTDESGALAKASSRPPVNGNDADAKATPPLLRKGGGGSPSNGAAPAAKVPESGASLTDMASHETQPAETDIGADGGTEAENERRPRLLDRISSIARTS